MNVAPWGLNAGFIALAANVAVFVMVSLVGKPAAGKVDPG
jgi:hypothetical protein